MEGFPGRNVVPSRCDLNRNFRFAPGRSVEDAESAVQALGRRFVATAEVSDRAPGGPAILDNPLLQELRELTAAPVEAKQAWTDVAQLAAMGIPAANVGPGEQAQAQFVNGMVILSVPKAQPAKPKSVKIPISGRTASGNGEQTRLGVAQKK